MEVLADEVRHLAVILHQAPAQDGLAVLFAAHLGATHCVAGKQWVRVFDAAEIQETAGLQLGFKVLRAELDYLTTSTAAAASLAEH